MYLVGECLAGVRLWVKSDVPGGPGGPGVQKQGVKNEDFLLISQNDAPTNGELNCGNFSSIQSKMAAWLPFLCKIFNKSVRNSKTIAPSNFVVITKIIAHGNMHPMNY